MNTMFIGRTPTNAEIEKLRLSLSTYQDGTGQLVFKSDNSLPGWRDFERSVALAFDGIAQESKAIFDVLIPAPQNPRINIGISCLSLCRKVSWDMGLGSVSLRIFRIFGRRLMECESSLL